MTFHKILTPTDFSGGSLAATRVAAALAQRLEAELHLLHIVETLPVFTYAQLGNFAAGQSLYEEEILKKAQENLENLRNELPDPGRVHPYAISRPGSPGAEIVSEATRCHADLLVMATHGRTGFAHALIGSVAEKVVRTAPCPVLTLKTPEGNGDEALSVSKILCPTDLSEESFGAFGTAVALARVFEAELHVLFVMDDPAQYPVVHWEYLPTPTAPAFYEHQEQLAEQSLQQQVARGFPENQLPECHLRRGTPYQEIVDHARESGTDLVVMSTHGRTGLRHAFMGSVAEKLVRLAPCPVVTVRGD